MFSIFGLTQYNWLENIKFNINFDGDKLRDKPSEALSLNGKVCEAGDRVCKTNLDVEVFPQQKAVYTWHSGLPWPFNFEKKVDVAKDIREASEQARTAYEKGVEQVKETVESFKQRVEKLHEAYQTSEKPHPKRPGIEHGECLEGFVKCRDALHLGMEPTGVSVFDEQAKLAATMNSLNACGTKMLSCFEQKRVEKIMRDWKKTYGEFYEWDNDVTYSFRI